MRALASLCVAVGLLAISPARARAQPMDPYGSDQPPPAPPPITPPATTPPATTPPTTDGATTPDHDAEVDEAVAAALVERAKQLMTAEDWSDAQQLLGEAIVRSPDGAAAAEAKPLLAQVNAKLGIVDQPPPPPPVLTPPTGPGTETPALPPPQPPRPETPTPALAGKAYLWHLALEGVVVGGFAGYAASAQDTGVPGAHANSGKGIVPGIILGGLAGVAVGTMFRHSTWLDHGDVVVADSFSGMGLIGSLELGAVMQPARNEAYGVNAVIGTIAGTVVGLVVAKHHDISAHRMYRVDLFALTGATVPWAVYAIGKGASSGAQRAAGLISMAGMVGGAWLGFYVTRHWDKHAAAPTDATVPAVVTRDGHGAWSLGSPAVRPIATAQLGLGPTLGKGAMVDVLGGRF